MTIVTVPETSSIARFGELLRQSLNAFSEACRVYVNDIDRDPALAAVYRTSYPDIPPRSWQGFEAVGRGVLVPQLLWAEGPGPRALTKLPMSTQTRLLNEPVELLTVDGDTLMVDVKAMSAAQARQVFASSHVRSLGEQRAWLETQRKPADPKGLPYRVRSGRLEVFRPVTFTRAELQRLLQGM